MVNGSNDTIQLNNNKKTTKECIHVGTQYTQNSLAYKHFTVTSMVTQCHSIAANIYNFLFYRRSNGNQEKQQK